jgi:hypothetical protein
MRFGDASPVMAISFANIPVEAMRPPMAWSTGQISGLSTFVNPIVDAVITKNGTAS